MSNNEAWSDEIWSPDYDPTVSAAVLDYPATGSRCYPAEPDITHRRGPGLLMGLCRWGFGQSHGYLP